MKKLLFPLGVMIGIIVSSCSSDEPTAVLNEAVNGKIGFSVTADNGSRAASAYENGTDITKMSVSAWLVGDANELPGYSGGNTANASYFLNDVLTRESGSGLFNYLSDARYWPANGETLDFFAVVDNEAWGDNGRFGFSKADGKPGLGFLSQLGINEMPDLLYAYTPNQKRSTANVAQQNVSFDFNHAFAKVIVTSEVKNENIRVYITDIEICGITDGGQLIFPHKTGEGSKIVNQPASWIVSPGYTDISANQGLFSANNPVVLDMKEVKKETLVGRGKTNGVINDLLVIPNSYNGRNSSGKIQTYVKLKGYAYNIADAKNGFDEDTDALIFPKANADGSVTPTDMLIPIEFNWGMGTVNRYNIVFDCGNGGSTTTNPNDPAFVRIGYEVEVTDWATGEVLEKVEYKK